MRSRREVHLLVQVARMYYERGLTQQDIAKQLDLSRQKVSRLLHLAREEGIVQITVVDPSQADHGLERLMRETFELKEVILTSCRGLDSVSLRRQIGIVGADYVVDELREGDIVGIGWGRTLNALVNALSGQIRTRIQVVPLLGGIGEMASSFQVNELARRLASQFGGSYRFLHVPAFSLDPAVWETLMRTEEVQQISELWKRVDVAIVGIGHLEMQRSSSMFLAGHVPPSTLATFEALGAVGDICGRFFDINGQQVEIGAGVIGVGRDQLLSLPKVIGIAGGAIKARAILGALRGGYLSTLIMDTETARMVLSEEFGGGGLTD